MVKFHDILALAYETNQRINRRKSKNSKRMNKELLSLVSRDKPILKKKKKKKIENQNNLILWLKTTCFFLLNMLTC